MKIVLLWEANQKEDKLYQTGFRESAWENTEIAKVSERLGRLLFALADISEAYHDYRRSWNMLHVAVMTFKMEI
jgi:hypothetical protein